MTRQPKVIERATPQWLLLYLFAESVPISIPIHSSGSCRDLSSSLPLSSTCLFFSLHWRDQVYPGPAPTDGMFSAECQTTECSGEGKKLAEESAGYFNCDGILSSESSEDCGLLLRNRQEAIGFVFLITRYGVAVISSMCNLWPLTTFQHSIMLVELQWMTRAARPINTDSFGPSQCFALPSTNMFQRTSIPHKNVRTTPPYYKAHFMAY